MMLLGSNSATRTLKAVIRELGMIQTENYVLDNPMNEFPLR